MNIYWWQGGMHIEPENEVERETLRLIWRIKRLDAHGDVIAGKPEDFISRLQLAPEPSLADPVSANTCAAVEQRTDHPLSD
jgi:hypothetical protein